MDFHILMDVNHLSALHRAWAPDDKVLFEIQHNEVHNAGSS